MADDPMLSLFDTDGSFLDDLTGNERGIGGPGNTMEGNFMGPQPGMQPESMMNPLQHQQNMGGHNQQGFGNQMGSQCNIGNMPYQQQQQFGDNFNQFNGNQKLHHINMPMSTNMPHSVPNQPMNVGQGQPFGSNVSHQLGYGSYGVGAVSQQVGPRLPNPHQQTMGMGQASGWNPNQDPSFMQQNAMRQQMMSPQQQQIPNTAMMGMRMQQQQQQNMPNVGGMQQQQQQNVGGLNSGMQQPFLNQQHEYALPTSSGTNPPQQNPNYPANTSGNQQAMFIQRIGSPNRMPHVPISSPTNPMVPNQSVPQHSFQQMGHQMRPPGFNGTAQQMQMHQQQQQQQPGFANSFIPQQHQQQVNMNSNTAYQRFQFPHGQQGGVNPMGDVHPQNAQFNSKTSPNQSQQFRPGYSGVPQQRATTPSPHPTPSPSVTPEAHTSPSSQGSIRHPVPLQQSEQMISPPQRSNSATPVSSPFHPSSRNENSQSVPNSYASPVHPSQNNQVNVSINSGPMPSEVSLNASSMSNTTVMIGQENPIVSMSNLVNPPPNIEMEIQGLQQQLNQLQGIPQTQQSQEKMLGLQERIRSLRAQQELQRQHQNPQHQQQQQQFQIHPQQQQQPHALHVAQSPGQQQMLQIQSSMSSGMQPQPNMGNRPQLIQIRQPNQFPGQPQKLLLVTQNTGGPMQRMMQPVVSSQQMVQGHGTMAVGSPQKMQVILQVNMLSLYN